MADIPRAATYQHITVDVSGAIATLQLRRPPNNFIDRDLVAEIADALEHLDGQPQCRAIVLAAEGRHFSAGADFSSRAADATQPTGERGRHLYKEAIRLFRTTKPIVAAIQGAAVGAGLGLAMTADFRVTCAEARFSANFTRLGFHPGFGLTATLPRLIGSQRAALLFYTGRRIAGDEAVAIGLADLLVPQAELLSAAAALAQEIAHSAPLAVVATRETLRRGLADAVQAATERELEEQDWQRRTEDFREGVKAMAERRLPDFKGR
jgi:enoyl-CoA hydratase/carnithine racemase